MMLKGCVGMWGVRVRVGQNRLIIASGDDRLRKQHLSYRVTRPGLVTAVISKITLIWDVTLCSLVGNHLIIR